MALRRITSLLLLGLVVQGHADDAIVQPLLNVAHSFQAKRRSIVIHQIMVYQDMEIHVYDWMAYQLAEWGSKEFKHRLEADKKSGMDVHFAIERLGYDLENRHVSRRLHKLIQADSSDPWDLYSQKLEHLVFVQIDDFLHRLAPIFFNDPLFHDTVWDKTIVEFAKLRRCA